MSKSKKKRGTRKRKPASRIPVPGQTHGSIPQGCNKGGFGRSKMYELGGRYPGLLVKLDGKTLVDFRVLDRILDSLPAASIR